MGDVVIVEMGVEKYDYFSCFNGKLVFGLGVKLVFGVNEMVIVELVFNCFDELV